MSIQTATVENASIPEESGLSVSNRTTLQEDVLSAFQGNIQPVRVPLTYRLGILLVTIVMLILPLIYLGITLLAGYAVYYHIVNHTGILNLGGGIRAQIMAIILYLAPVIIGGILVLFMFKPIFSRPPRRAEREPVDREKEPLLFAFVERVCTAVGAPRPKRIELDCEVNASASFRRGFLSMFSNDLVLTIGMPLVAGLTLREFAGVLAHEFGHFAQGAGMRLTYIIRSISHWFTRVVYERDEWDRQLVEWSKTWDIRLGWIVYLARFFVWLTRRILWVLMYIGHAVSSYMLRQMEFDADRHEARLAGSDAFESTMRNITTLGIAEQGAHQDLNDFYREGRLGDNMPKLIQHNVNQFSPEAHSKIGEMMTSSKTSLFATHPSESDRIANAHREDTTGIFQTTLPSSALFTDFEAQCEAVTWDFYKNIFGDRLQPDDVHDLDNLLARQEEEQEAFKALARYLQGTFQNLRPLQLPAWELTMATASTDPPSSNWGQQLESDRVQMVQEVPTYQANLAQYRQTESSSEQATLADELTSFETQTGQRLLNCLQLLGMPEIRDEVAQAAEWHEESQRLLPILKLLNEQVDSLQELHIGNQLLAGLLQMLPKKNDDQALIAAILEQRDRNLAQIKQIRTSLESADYPFEHAKKGITLSKFALEEMPHQDDINAILQAADHLVQASARLRARLTGHLCLIAEGVEAALNLEPLPVPADEEADEGVVEG